MTITALGQVSVGVAVPGVSSAVAAGTAGISSTLPELLARLAALEALPITPPDFAAQIVLANQMAAAATAALSLGLPLPDLGPAFAAAIAALEALIAALQAQLAVLVNLTAPLTAAGVGLYVFDGSRDQLGYELGQAIGPGALHCNALALVTVDPVAWAGLSAVMKVSA